MKTDSILEMLQMKFGHGEPYSENELTEISRLSVKRFDIDKSLLRVNFDDLKNFNAVTNLTINSCVIDKEIINKISELKTLGTLVLINCSLNNSAKKELKKTSIKNLIIDFGEVNIDCASDFKLDSLVLNGFRIKKGLNFIATDLDVSRCEIADNNILDNKEIEKVTISYSQYIKDISFFDSLKKNVKIMEDNGQFVYKELKNNG